MTVLFVVFTALLVTGFSLCVFASVLAIQDHYAKREKRSD